jgi:hypothetical protein
LFPRHILRGAACLDLLQRSDYLRLSVPTFAHLLFPFPSSKSYSNLDGFRGMEFASWVASSVALHHGGRSGLPTLKSLRAESRTCISDELSRTLGTTSRWKPFKVRLQ